MRKTLYIISLFFISSGFAPVPEQPPLSEKQKAMIGKTAPEFSLPDMNWENVNSSELEGDVILIDFWASWCKGCRFFNQELVDLKKEYGDKGLQIVSISFDTDYYKWKNATKMDGITWVNLNESKGMESETAVRFNIDHTPTSFLLDKNRTIVAIDLEDEVLETKIKELLQ